ncbi:MAG TPA: hypothetical protein VKU80_09095 [Planctomycetota bacterium]|nr:hypothetical protein [Planctomycetota bacterium]
MLRFLPVLTLGGFLLGAQDVPGIESGLHDLWDVSAGGWNRRLGPDYMTSNPSGSGRKAPPMLFQPAPKFCPWARNAKGMTYEVGGPPVKEAGDFSSTQAQVLYATDSGGAGLDRILVLDMENKCLSEKPEPPWWGGFRPDPAVQEWREKRGASPGGPVGIARGMGTWSNHAVIVFRNGLVGTAGTATSQGTHPVFQFPTDKVPTALAVTPRNEMVLVTVFDTRQRKGQLAILAMESCAPNFAHDWHDRYPLLPSVASYSDIKLLGYVDLPIQLPSAVSGGGDKSGGWLHSSGGGNVLPKEIDLGNPEIRGSFVKGSNAGWISTTGYAVVLSKQEQKAVFIDLQPLFSGIKQAYFGSSESWRKTRDLGPKPRQWPWTFDAEPSLRPAVVASIDVPRPVSVYARTTGGLQARAFIGCQDGTLISYRVGGLATGEAPNAEGIREAGRLAVGRNPVWIAAKGTPGGADTGFIVVSRGDRTLQWVKFSKDQGTIVRELRDERMADPVYAEVADTHGIETEIVTVADFKGRRIINYRCRPVVFATNGGARFGCGPKGDDEFECGGILMIPGNPIAVCGTNVN